MDQFHLTDNDKATGLWLRLRAHLEARLADARVRNDGEMGEHSTASIRGEIRLLKRLLALGDDDRPRISDFEEQP